MRDQIKFGIVRSLEELEDLKRFAKSFDHKVGNDSIMPIYTITRGQQLIGYYNVILYPIVSPSMHPRLCSHRDFFDALFCVKHHFCLNSIDAHFPNGTCLLAVPTKLAIPDRALERAGFKNTKKEIWQHVP
jgi:hypothetical protein